MNHCQLEVGRGVVYRQSSAFCQRHNEDRGKAQQVSRTDNHLGMSQGLGYDAPEIAGSGAKCQAEHGNGDGWFRNRSYGHFATCAHPPECCSWIQTGERQKEGAKQKQINEGKQVADCIKGSWSDKNGNEKCCSRRARKYHVRSRPKQPG